MYVQVKPFAQKAKILSELSVYSGEITIKKNTISVLGGRDVEESEGYRTFPGKILGQEMGKKTKNRKLGRQVKLDRGGSDGPH